MFQVGYTGYNTKNLDCDTIYRPKGTGEYLFLLVLSPMHFYIENSHTLATSGACMLYTPDVLQHYKAEKEFLNSFVHFRCSIDFLSEYPIQANQLFYPGDTEEINWYLKKIHYEECLKASYYETMVDSYCHQLFATTARNTYALKNTSTTYTELFAIFQQLRHNIISRCHEDWTIRRMCEYVNLEKSQLYTYYEQFFHISPKSDLIQARIDKAKYLLTNEAMLVQQVSHAAGFHNIYHFSRYFKQCCGCTPSEFAKKSVHISKK